MDFQTSLNRIEELFRIMYLGLWVLWAETRWICLLYTSPSPRDS